MPFVGVLKNSGVLVCPHKVPFMMANAESMFVKPAVPKKPMNVASLA